MVETDIPDVYKKSDGLPTPKLRKWTENKHLKLTPLLAKENIVGCTIFHPTKPGLSRVEKVPEELEHYEIPSPEATHLTFLTYNVWFEAHNIKERYQTVLQILRESKADFICL